MQIKKVKKLSQSELNQISLLHKNILTESFINNFGLDFLKIVYQTIFSSPTNICFILEKDKKIIGFLVATFDGQKFNKEVIQKNFFNLTWQIFKTVILHPNLLFHLLKWLIIPSPIKKIPPELQFIAINPNYQHQGWGHKFITQLNQTFKKSGIKNYRVGTKSGNKLSNAFYKKLRFKYIYQDNFFGSQFNYYQSPNLF